MSNLIMTKQQTYAILDLIKSSKGDQGTISFDGGIKAVFDWWMCPVHDNDAHLTVKFYYKETDLVYISAGWSKNVLMDIELVMTHMTMYGLNNY